jgi:hypothetical protein
MATRDIRAITLISRILHGPLRPQTYQDIATIVSSFGTPDLIVYYPEIKLEYHVPTIATTPLIAAILRGDPEMIDAVLSLGADINYGGGLVIGTPLDYAIYTDNLPLAEFLREHGAISEQPISPRVQEALRRRNFFTLRPGEGSEFLAAQQRYYQQR